MDPDELNKGNTTSPSPAIAGLDDLPPITEAEDDTFSPPPAPPVEGKPEVDLSLPPLPSEKKDEKPELEMADVSSEVTASDADSPEVVEAVDDSKGIKSKPKKKISKKAIVGGVLAILLLVGAPLVALNIDKFRGDTRSSADDLSRAANYGQSETVTEWSNPDGGTSTANERDPDSEDAQADAAAAAAQAAIDSGAAERTRMAAIQKKAQQDAAAAKAAKEKGETDAVTAVGGGKLTRPAPLADQHEKIEPSSTTTGANPPGLADGKFELYQVAYNVAIGDGIWTDQEKHHVNMLGLAYLNAAEEEALENYKAWAEAANASGPGREMEIAMDLAEKAADLSFQRQELQTEINLYKTWDEYINLYNEVVAKHDASNPDWTDQENEAVEAVSAEHDEAVLASEEVKTEIRAADALSAYNDELEKAWDEVETAIENDIAANGGKGERYWKTEKEVEDSIKDSQAKIDLDEVMEEIYVVKGDVHDFVFKITDEDRRKPLNDNPTGTNCTEGFINTSGACCGGVDGGRAELIFRYKDCTEKYNCNAGPACVGGTGTATLTETGGFSSEGGGSSSTADSGGSGCGADVCSDPSVLQVGCEADGTKNEQLCPGWSCREETCGGTKYFCTGSGDNLAWSTDGGSCGYVGVCVETKVYTMQGGQWVATPLSKVGENAKEGDKVRFATKGNNVTFSQGRFKVNDGSWISTNTKNTADEFYIEYTLDKSGKYSVEGQVQ
jgi:hypothetical protein